MLKFIVPTCEGLVLLSLQLRGTYVYSIVADIISGFYFTILRFVHVFGKRLKVPVGSEEGE